MNIVRRMAATPRRRLLLLVEAALFLALARLTVVCLPFRRWSRWLGVPHATVDDALAEPEALRAGPVIAAVRSAARHVPWNAVCLPQAMAAKWMLRRRGIRTTFYFGVRKDDADRFESHAWLGRGERILIGETPGTAFTVIAHFA